MVLLELIGAAVIAVLASIGVGFLIAKTRFDNQSQSSQPLKEEQK